MESYEFRRSCRLYKIKGFLVHGYKKKERTVNGQIERHKADEEVNLNQRMTCLE